MTKNMGTIVSGFLFFLLGVTVFGQDNEGTSLDENVRVAVTRAVQWMKDQRREDYSWGGFTPRAVVALALSQEVVPISKDEMTVMTKQLNMLLSLELGRNFSMKSMRLSRLALYVNALYATCQDPRNFHGQDLVRILRSRTDSALVNASDFNLPVVFIPLCLAQDVTHQDVRNIVDMYRSHGNKTDFQALTLLALSCIAQMNRSVINKQYVDSFAAGFVQHFQRIAPSSDVYTLALALQVLRSISSSSVNVSSLMEKQFPDGSFGSLLGTYYALPALLGRNVFTIKNRHCIKDGFPDQSLSYPIPQPSYAKVYYSIWMGERDAQDLHSVIVPLPSNGTFFDIMQMAQARNSNFRFSYEEKNHQKHVYSLGGAPNDVQRQLSWILYKTTGEHSRINSQAGLHKITRGVDRIYPAPEDRYIFWFRRHSSY